MYSFLFDDENRKQSISVKPRLNHAEMVELASENRKRPISVKPRLNHAEMVELASGRRE
jgi:hypothetical protein